MSMVSENEFDPVPDAPTCSPQQRARAGSLRIFFGPGRGRHPLDQKGARPLRFDSLFLSRDCLFSDASRSC